VSAVSLIGGSSVGPEKALSTIGSGAGSWIAERRRLAKQDSQVTTLAGIAGIFGGVFSSPVIAVMLILEVARPGGQRALQDPGHGHRGWEHFLRDLLRHRRRRVPGCLSGATVYVRGLAATRWHPSGPVRGPSGGPDGWGRDAGVAAVRPADGPGRREISAVQPHPPRRLTTAMADPRELDVLREMARGRANPGIAAALVLSESAVEKHVSSIFAKLGLGPEPTQDRRVTAELTFLRDAPQPCQ
jgi:Bacterial regulatory proteins, luxR family/Voltage gated chloride channel